MSRRRPQQEERGLPEEKLSPGTKRKLQCIIQNVVTGEVIIDEDDSGRPVLRYQAKPLAYVDKSQANQLSVPKIEKHFQDALEVCLQLIEYIKEQRAPSGVVLDKTKISSTRGKYREGKEFERLEQVLGKGNSAGNIVVVKDNSNLEHAMKTVVISEFRKQEVRAWVDLSDSGIAPSLYMFRLKDNKVEMHMEILKNVVTLQSVLDDMMDSVYAEDPALLRPFSLFVFHGLLKAAQVMHEKNWSHQDLHAGNVLLQKGDSGKIEVKVIDFGQAKRIRTTSGTLTASGVESDILEIIRNFTALYTGEGFEDRYELKREKDREEKLREATKSWKDEDRKELFDLIAMALAVIDVKSKHFHRPAGLIKKLKKKMDEDYEKALKKVAAILFPRKDLPAHTEMDDLETDGPSADDNETDEDSFVRDYLHCLSIQPK